MRFKKFNFALAQDKLLESVYRWKVIIFMPKYLFFFLQVSTVQSLQRKQEVGKVRLSNNNWTLGTLKASADHQ